jgi:DegV family protein with EDD domain
MAAKDMILEEYPEKSVHVIDSLSAGPELTVLLYKLTEFIKSGLGFDEIVEKITEYQNNTGLAFMLDSLDNFVRNGRVNKYVAKITGVLGIRIIGRASTIGELEVVHKARGKYMDLLVNMIIDDGYNGGKMVIATCKNTAGAEKLKTAILIQFPTASIEIMPTSGLCSYYAERNGLLVGFEKN